MTKDGKVLQLWIPVVIFFVIHQSEEVIFSLDAWRYQVTLPDWSIFVNRSLMFGLNSQFLTALVVVAQCAGIGMIAYLLRNSIQLTRWAITVLLLVLMLAFTLHIVLSLVTYSLMPGVYTSIFPGLPVGGYLIYWVWHGSKVEV